MALPASTDECDGKDATIVGRRVAPTQNPVHGTQGRDVIVGTHGPDIIFARGGDDVVCGRG